VSSLPGNGMIEPMPDAMGASEGGVHVNTRCGQRTEVGAAATAVDDSLLAEVVAGVVKRVGALLGSTPDEAFFVRCDATTMTVEDLANGRLICEVGVAPVRPAEFVIFRIGQWTATTPCPPERAG